MCNTALLHGGAPFCFLNYFALAVCSKVRVIGMLVCLCEGLCESFFTSVKTGGWNSRSIVVGKYVKGSREVAHNTQDLL